MGELIIILLIVGAIVAMRSGWKGRRVGDAPHCKACNFDLTGVFPQRTVCPECGADLTGGPAVTSGRFERRWKRLTLGIVVLVLSVTIPVLSIGGTLSKGRLVRLLPTQTLIDECVLKPQSMIAWEGRYELGSRLAVGKLSDAEQHTLLDAVETLLATNVPRGDSFAHGLLTNLVQASNIGPTVLANLGTLLIEKHADPTSPWDRSWSNLSTAVREQGGITPEHWQAALVRGLTPISRHSGGEAVPPGETFLLAIDPNTRALDVDELDEHLTINLADGLERVGQYGYAWEDDLWTGYPDRSEQPILLLRAPTTPGEYEITTTRTIQYQPQGRFGTPPAWRLAKGTKLTHTLTIRVAGTTDPTAKGDREAWLKRHMILTKFRRGSWPYQDSSVWLAFQICFGFTEPDFAAGGQLVAVAPDGTETVLDRFECRFTGNSSSWVRRNANGKGSGNSTVSSGKRSGLPFVELESPLESLRPDSTARLVIIFDEITLPPPFAHEGSEPIRIELDRSALPVSAWGR
jgi:hypothetical protein